MTHSTLPSLPSQEQKQYPSPASPFRTLFPSAPAPTRSSSLSALSSTSPAARKRSFLSKHMRSKSSSSPSSSPPMPSFAGFPASASRQHAPPLLRTSSLPLTPTINSVGGMDSIGEGKVQHRYMITTGSSASMAMGSPVHHPPRPPLHHRSRSSSPTRLYASSQSPAMGQRGGSAYYPGSSFPSPFQSSPSSSSSSPTLPAYLVNESFMPSSYSTSSSSPSTPTSCRSRSPSISSLETIPDSPDAEQEALEAETQAALERAAAKASSPDMSDEDSGSRRRSSLDGPRDSFGLGSRSRDKRKRWSVCGGEKRGDLELETIWEEACGRADSLGIIGGDGMGNGEMI